MNENDYTKLQKAYNEWEKDYFVLFLGFQANGDYWPACNLFVGEVIFRAYGAKKSMNGDKYKINLVLVFKTFNKPHR